MTLNDYDYDYYLPGLFLSQSLSHTGKKNDASNFGVGDNVLEKSLFID